MTIPLTSEQRAIVKHPAPISLVSAGPGTGKTTTLMAKAAAAAKHLKPGQCMLMLAFSTQAATEFEQGLTSSYPRTASVTEIATMHAFGYQLIITHHDRLGYAHPPTVDTRNTTKPAIKQAIKRAFASNPLSTEQEQALATAINQATPQDHPTARNLVAKFPLLQPIANKSLALIKHGQAQKRQGGHVNFSDQITLALALLESHPDICQTISRRYALLLVDEFQDLSPPELQLIKMLIPLIPKVMIVGDEAQQIYGFRGAIPDVFSVIQQAFPTAKSFELTQSHRCSQPTLDLANHLRATMRHVTPLTVVSRHPQRPARPLYLPCTTRQLQNAAVFRVYARLTQDRGLPPQDITILARSKISLLEVHRYLEIHDVPALIGHRQVLATVGDTLLTFLALMEDHATPLNPVLNRFGLDHSHANRQALRTLGTTTDPLLKYLIGKIKQGKQCHYYEEKINLIADCLKRRNPDDKVFITAYINQLKRLMRTCPNLTAVRRVIRQYQRNHTQTMTLQTLHSFKGGENNAVLIVDVVDGHFPDRRTLDTQQHNPRLEEEKCLLYVGITRSERYLCLLSAPYPNDHHRPTQEKKAPKCSLLSAKLKSLCITRPLTSPADITRLFPLN